MRKLLLPLAVLALSTPAIALPAEEERDAAADYAEREGCILPQAVAPSFNNSAVAVEQMRIAAVTMRKAANRNGDTMTPICGSEHDPRDLPGEKTMGEPAPVEQEAADATDAPEQQATTPSPE